MSNILGDLKCACGQPAQTATLDNGTGALLIETVECYACNQARHPQTFTTASR